MLALASCKSSPPVRTETRTDEPVAAVDEPPTYANRIAAILERRCASCHAEGGIGPMPLTTFEEARTHAGAIGFQTKARTMPPWLPETKACAPLQHARTLDDDELRAVTRWIESGAPEGTGPVKRAPPPAQTYGALAAKPDRVVVPDEAYTPKRARADDYHCFVLDPKLERPERIVGLRIAPGLPALVHHVLLFEVRASAVPKITELDARDPGPGYSCFGGIGVMPTVRPGNLVKGELVDFDAQMIVGWAPGAGATDIAGAPTALPAGTAIKLAPGSRLVMQVHYSLENASPIPAKVGADRTRVDMWTAPEGAALRQAVWVPLLKYDFRVPAGAGPGDPRATARAEYELPLPLEVLGVAPHMHLRGSSIKVETFTDDDPASCLLDVPRWSFHHQEGYWLSKGVRARKAAITCTWDNRTSKRELRWGEGTNDEMCLAFLYATL